MSLQNRAFLNDFESFLDSMSVLEITRSVDDEERVRWASWDRSVGTSVTLSSFTQSGLDTLAHTSHVTSSG